MSKPEDNYIGILLEEIRDQNRAVLEAVGDLQRRVIRVEEKVENLPTREEFATATAAIAEQSRQLHEHEQQHNGHFRVRRAT